MGDLAIGQGIGQDWMVARVLSATITTFEDPLKYWKVGKIQIPGSTSNYKKIGAPITLRRSLKPLISCAGSSYRSVFNLILNISNSWTIMSLLQMFPFRMHVNE